MAGVPLEALLSPDDTRTVSYAPSATVFRYFRKQPRSDLHAGLLALSDPVYQSQGAASDAEPLPDHGVLVNVVVPGSNAATHGLKQGDVLLVYNGKVLNKKEDLQTLAEGDKPIGVELWRNGQESRGEVAAGKLGVVLDARPASEAIAERRKLDGALIASRSGGNDEFAPLPATRYEVYTIALLFRSVERPTRTLLGDAAGEAELDRLAGSGELARCGFIHLATHGVIDEAVPARSAVILTQTGLPNPLDQILSQKSVFDGRLTVRKIQRGWELKAELVTLSACETALGRQASWGSLRRS
jgi:CHAT domain